MGSAPKTTNPSQNALLVVDRGVVAVRLRQAREAAGLTQKGLGIAAGLDAPGASARMNHYEQGRREPGASTLRVLGEVLNVPMAYFYAEDDRLADLILAFSKLSKRAQVKAVLRTD